MFSDSGVAPTNAKLPTPSRIELIIAGSSALAFCIDSYNSVPTTPDQAQMRCLLPIHPERSGIDTGSFLRNNTAVRYPGGAQRRLVSVYSGNHGCTLSSALIAGCRTLFTAFVSSWLTWGLTRIPTMRRI